MVHNFNILTYKTIYLIPLKFQGRKVLRKVAHADLRRTPHMNFLIFDNAELEITVGHWPFSNQFQFARISLLHIFNGGKPPIIVYKNVLTFIEWPTNF